MRINMGPKNKWNKKYEICLNLYEIIKNVIRINHQILKRPLSLDFQNLVRGFFVLSYTFHCFINFDLFPKKYYAMILNKVILFRYKYLGICLH